MIAFANQDQDKRFLKELVLCSAKKRYLRIKSLLTSDADMPKFKLSICEKYISGHWDCSAVGDLEVLRRWGETHRSSG